MTIIPLVKSEFAARSESIEQMVQQCEILVLAASHEPKNDKLIDRKVIDAMQGKYFINTSRGELVDENYLLAKTEEGHFAGVAIDVIASEQKTDNNKKKVLDLLQTDVNFIYTPHVGGATISSMHKTELYIVQKLADFLDKGIYG